jgi:IS5 family transposase
VIRMPPGPPNPMRRDPTRVAQNGKKKWFFGYKLHILADSFWELPIVVKVTTAKESDSPHLRKAQGRHPWFEPEVVSADSGYDGINNYQGIDEEFQAIAIIDIRDMGRKWAFYNQQGIPYCLGRKLMEYVGSDEQGHSYRCVADKCHLKGGQGRRYCDYVITVQPEDDLRKIGKVARVSAQWKELFSRRSAVERVNSRLKETRRLQAFCFRRIWKVTAHCLRSVLTMQAAAVAQARVGELEGVRQCLRKVA